MLFPREQTRRYPWSAFFIAARHLIRSLAAWLLAVGVATCSDVSSVPLHRGQGRIALAPVFSKSAAAVLAQRTTFPAVTFDHLHLVLVRPPNEVVLDTTVAFTPDSPTLTLDATVAVKVTNEVFSGALDFTNAGSSVYHADISRIVSYAPGEAVPPQPDIAVRYVGVGANAARVTIAPKTTTVQMPSTVPFTATAFDANNAPIANVPLAWSTSDPTVATITASNGSSGALSTAGKRGTVVVSVQTPTGLSDNATVAVTLPAASIVLASGGGQTGKAGSALTQPGVVRVLASDGAGVAGVTVNFAAPSGGSVGASSVTTDATGTASTSLTLGGAAGPQAFAATAAGFTVSIPVTATASDPAVIAAISGSGQRDTVLRLLKDPFVVKVSDAFGNAVPNVSVAWTRVAGLGLLDGTTTVTGADGMTSIAYTLGGIVGTETVTASVSGVATPATFTVTSVLSIIPVASVTVVLNTLNLFVVQTVQAIATARDAQGNVLTGRTVSAWTSSNPAVATVSIAGLVLAVAPGTATISATIDGVTGTSSVLTVNPLTVPVATVTVTLNALSLLVDQGTQAIATPKDAQGNVLTGRTVSAWSSSNPLVAAVSETGVVTALALGTATISATIDGVTGTSPPLTVSLVSVAKVTVSLAASSLIVGQTTQATATSLDALGLVVPGQTVSAWTSSNPAVATVSASGLVTAVSPGTATFTATIDGVRGTSSALTVTAPTGGSVTVTLTPSTIAVLKTSQATAVVRDASGAIITGALVAWMSSDPLVATVNPSTGVVTGLVPGTATITGTSLQMTGSARITVTP